MSLLGKLFGSAPRTSSDDQISAFDHTATLIAESTSSTFSCERFEKHFGGSEFAENWSKDDALGVWYSLGVLSLVAAIWNAYGTNPSKASLWVEVSRIKLAKRWNLSSRSRERLMRFVNENEAAAFEAFHACSDSVELSSFFSRYCSHILGSPVPLTNRSTFEDQLAGYQFQEHDPITIASISSLFIEVTTATAKLLRSV